MRRLALAALALAEVGLQKSFLFKVRIASTAKPGTRLCVTLRQVASSRGVPKRACALVLRR